MDVSGFQVELIMFYCDSVFCVLCSFFVLYRLFCCSCMTIPYIPYHISSLCCFLISRANRIGWEAEST